MMEAEDRLQYHKIIIRQSALLTRRAMVDEVASSAEAAPGTYGTLARALWCNDTSIATRLINNTSLGATHIGIQDKRVFL